MGNRDNDISISAVIPAYNADEYIARAIDSVLKQTHSVDEIIVIDDGSTDSTAEAVKHYGQKVHYIYQPNAGVSAARNAGIEAAVSNWIAFLDADDEWMPNKIELQTEVLSKNPDLAWISGNYLRCLCDENRQRPYLSETVARQLTQGKDVVANFFEAFMKNVWGCTDTMLIRKEVLTRAGLFRLGQKQMEDIDLWWNIARTCPEFGYIAKPIAIYHLNIKGSLIQGSTDFAACRQMIRRQLETAQDKPCADLVRACSAQMLRVWMRGMLFKEQADEIKKMLSEFDSLFSIRYKCIMRMLTFHPSMTASCLRMISRIVRFLRIRQQLTRKPKKNDA